MLLSTFFQSLAPLVFRNIVINVMNKSDATYNILIYCLIFKFGTTIMSTLKDLFFAYFSAYNEEEIACMLFKHV